MKFTKAKQAALREFLDIADANGCAVSGAWTSGSGRYTKPRVLPPFVHKIEKGKRIENGIHRTAVRKAEEFFAANPRRSVVLVFDRRAFEDAAFTALDCKEV